MTALSVGRLLSGLTPALNQGRRYWVQVAWILTLTLVAVLQWWFFWNMKQVAWTPIRFLWALSNPGILFLIASVLVGEDPGSVTKYAEHFFQQRVRFFSLQLVAGAGIGLSPWVLGMAPWFTSDPSHGVAAGLTALSIAGLCFRNPTAHAIIVCLNLLFTASSFFLIPLVTPAA